MVVLGCPSSSASKESTCNSEDPSLIPGSEGTLCLGFTGGSDSKESVCNVGELGLFPGLRRSPGGGHGNPLQYSCLKNPHEQKSLAGYSPWGCKESDTTGRPSSAQHKDNERGFPGGSDVKESACNAGNPGSISGSGRSPGEGNIYPLQCSCLENSMDRGAWQATVHGITKSWTQLSN